LGNSLAKPRWSNLYLPRDIAMDIARERMSALAGAYSGASRSRREISEWTVSGGDADADLLWDLPVLRERSRDLERNNPLAAGAFNTKVTSIVGAGIVPQSQIDFDLLGLSKEESKLKEQEIEREFWLHAGSREFDAGRRLSFLRMQDVALRSHFVNGDSFAVRSFFARPGSPYATKWQLLEADQVCNKDNVRDTRELSAGVKRDVDTGAPNAYQIKTVHPGSDSGYSSTWREIPAFDSDGRPNVLHIMRMTRIGQTRGVPDLAPVIEAFKQLGRYTEAELMAAVVSGMFTVFVKSESGDASLEEMLDSGEAPSKNNELRLGNGAIVGLASNESIDTANPGRPNESFDPFIQSILRQIGVALELPFEIVIKHFTSSFAASRAALLEAWRYFMARRAWLSEIFCQPIYEALLEEAVARGRIVAPGFLEDPAIRRAYCRAAWVGPAQGQIDPTKETNAAEKRLALRISTRQEECAALTGGDWDAKINQIQYEESILREIGPLTEATEATAEPEDEDEDDN